MKFIISVRIFMAFIDFNYYIYFYCQSTIMFRNVFHAVTEQNKNLNNKEKRREKEKTTLVIKINRI